MTRLRAWLAAWLYLDPDLIEDIGNCPDPTPKEHPMPSPEQHVATMPGRDEILRRLTAVDNNHHITTGLYPKLLKLADRDLTGLGVVLALHLAVVDYTTGFPPIMTDVLLMRVETFTRALLADSPALDDALDALGELGLVDRPAA